jgi:ABC-type nitrate/sulfonate/bicarbonate transport system ATPase subunit
MDEAFSALDPGTRRGMQRLIRELWKSTGTTILFVTHNMQEAMAMGSRLVVLAKATPDSGSRIALDLSAPFGEGDERRLERVVGCDPEALTSPVEAAAAPAARS